MLCTMLYNMPCITPCNIPYSVARSIPCNMPCSISYSVPWNIPRQLVDTHAVSYAVSYDVSCRKGATNLPQLVDLHQSTVDVQSQDNMTWCFRDVNELDHLVQSVCAHASAHASTLVRTLVRMLACTHNVTQQGDVLLSADDVFEWTGGDGVQNCIKPNAARRYIRPRPNCRCYASAAAARL